MNDLDDRPLIRPAPEADARPDPVVASSRRALVAITVVGVILGGFAAWWWTSDRPAPTADALTAGTDAVIAPATEAVRPLPPLEQMDTFLRALLSALSSRPELARWLATDDLTRQIAHAIDRISRGFSPAPDLAILRPRDGFATTGPAGRLSIDPRSFERYTGLASLVSSLDARRIVEAYRVVRPRLNEAYRALGRSDNDVDTAIEVALTTLIETPTIKSPIALVPGQGATYAYADPDLERLRPVQKQLLRMGPANAARIQSRLREIRDALTVR
ncbi:MAG TPA: DUF3014 domain-containing protein [Vicinamibacterales bacterium]|nr:DUF3014 domain-containing protein [Vicinamibacterales bacterium]